MTKNLTEGNVTKTMLLFAAPMIAGNLLQQCYNIADSLIVGRFLGADALAAVGSSYTLMTFLTSVLIGLCMGSGSLFSYYFGKSGEQELRDAAGLSFLFIGAVAVLINIGVYAGADGILRLLQVPDEVYGWMREYVTVVFAGLFFVFLYNYFAYYLRAMGNSVAPLYFLGLAALLNIVLDLLFVVRLSLGIRGAALATVLAQVFSGVGLGAYTIFSRRVQIFNRRVQIFNRRVQLFGAGKEREEAGGPEGRDDEDAPAGMLRRVIRFSLSACVQQSVMNFGILMIQGLVNSFGAAVMAAFAAAVKIDTLAYMPAQEFANAYSIFISQNYGADKRERMKEGTRRAAALSLVFCALVGVFVWLAAAELMEIFVGPGETAVIGIGVGYLRIEGAFYFGIGLLFLFYGYFRGSGRPEHSVLLTVISLGTRVALAYLLSPIEGIGVYGIWWAIPIGWILADITGAALMRKERGKQTVPLA